MAWSSSPICSTMLSRCLCLTVTTLLIGGAAAFEASLPGTRLQVSNKQPATQTTRMQSNDLVAADSRPSPLAHANLPIKAHQTNVYHSIIDRTPILRSANSAILSDSTLAAMSPSPVGDLHTAAGHHHKHSHGKYYEYREVPKKKTWKFGYKRGNHKHTIMRHEHGKAGKHPHFKTKVKWHDKKSKGKGIHLWDYNHHDKKHYG